MAQAGGKEPAKLMEVKLNNPLMGTETFEIPNSSSSISAHRC